MNLLTLNQFAVLLWKNFTLKRRQFLNLILEVLTALAFPMMLLLLRAVIHITVAGPYTFTSQPISTLPSFLQNDERWELIYVPSNIDVVKEITENVKRNLNISIKVQGFSSEIEFEKYIKYDYRAHKVLAAIVFDCDFKNRHDPLPLQIFNDPVFYYSDYSFIFVFLMCYAIASIFFGFMVSTFFNKARLAASAGSFIYFVSFFPFNSIAQYYGRINLTMKVAACLSPNIALALGIKLLVKFETKRHYPPTRGEVFIDGYDITKNITEIRENLGFCPQGDLLFNDLTLSEHLFFYSMVKNIHQKMSSNEINHILSTFDLLEKRDTFSKSLSGGTKRKLSIIIALLGGSKVVILDEPSSGMDPFSRRATWDILQQFKHDRTILLTTHYMDEADILGDRIAIMVKGTLQCCGSSIFLKKTYGLSPFDYS
ncbi:hypothetical protein E5288_WYG013993 [Bos mutus]|uniref:ABC transporter domain-containing protein n=1 Tax=Bos mutus TaxID=72004 RepID=A0A6B0RKJ4_9CETA|nr:hypothetical protein [Bos mutus]